MGLVCRLVFQPVIKLIQIVVAVIEYILIQICRFIQELVSVVTQVLAYVCNTVVHTVCGAVCSVICGICDFFCGIFGCDCGCENVCNNVCNTVTDVVCGWTYILQTILEYVTRFICNYLLQAIVTLLNLVEAIVTMVLTWICSLIDIFIRWLLCWTYLAEIFNNTNPRRFRVVPKIIPNNEGHSAWFVYVNNPTPAGSVDQNVRGYILSDQGRPLIPIVSDTNEIRYVEVRTRGDVITGEVRRGDGEVEGRPFLYYPYKVMEISSHLFGDVFAGDASDDGRGTNFEKNLLTYNTNVQAWLDRDGKLAENNYNKWSGKYTSPGSGTYFGDRSIGDMGMRVDTDSTCSHPTNTFLNLIDDIVLTAGNSAVAESMTCGPSQSLTFDEMNFLMLNKGDGSAVTTYFVSRYAPNESSVGCNDVLGYTVVSFAGGDAPLFIGNRVIEFTADTNPMMARIVENVSSKDPAIVRVAETYLHECGHQCGLLHDTDKPECENDKTLHISKLMNPGGNVRRAYTRLQWCMVRGSTYVTSDSITPFTQAPELPDSGTVPPTGPR
jgi:hypothetical protein